MKIRFAMVEGTFMPYLDDLITMFISADLLTTIELERVENVDSSIPFEIYNKKISIHDTFYTFTAASLLTYYADFHGIRKHKDLFLSLYDSNKFQVSGDDFNVMCFKRMLDAFRKEAKTTNWQYELSFNDFKKAYLGQFDATNLKTPISAMRTKLLNNEITTLEQVNVYCSEHPNSDANTLLWSLSDKINPPTKGMLEVRKLMGV